jgi:hypothetical protein
MESEATNMIVENVKIDKKTISWKHTLVRNGYDFLKNATIITKRTGNNLFVFIVTARRTQRWGSMSIERRDVTKL